MEQPRQGELQRDDRSSGIYQSRVDGPSDDDDDDDDDDDATLEDNDLDIEEQQSTVVATTVDGRREHSKGYKPPTASTTGDGQCSDDISEGQVRRLINSLQHTTEGSDDDEMQLVFQAARQLETGQHRSPNYAESASQQT